MAKSHDYIPQTEGGLLVFSKNLYAYALANYSRWSVPSPQATLEAVIAAYEKAFAAFNNPNHGKVDTANKNDTKKALIRSLRTYIQGFIARNPGVSNEDKEKMSLPLRDLTPTARPAPDIRPDTEAVPAGKGTHTVTAINPEVKNRDKPDFVTGVAFAKRLRKQGENVSRAGDMPSDFQAGTSRVYQYAEAEYGMIADYATAYESASGKRGPWSNVTSLLISG